MERMAYEFCEDAYYAGIVYAEVRYSPELALGSKAMKEVGPQGNVQDFRYIYLKVSLFILRCMNIWMQHCSKSQLLQTLLVRKFRVKGLRCS